MTLNEVKYFLSSMNVETGKAEYALDTEKYPETYLPDVAQIILTSNECIFCDGKTKFKFVVDMDINDGYLEVMYENPVGGAAFFTGSNIIIPYFELVGFQRVSDTQRKQAYLYGGTN